jgi:hypothetical protein
MNAKRLLTGSLALAALALAAFAPSASADSRTCGLLPGDGAYSYVKTHDISCRKARHVGNKAGRRFCRADGCDALPNEKPDEGTVRVGPWKCKMKVGWEAYQARCRNGDKSFLQRSGA